MKGVLSSASNLLNNTEYFFETSEKIGYSIMLQSALSQPATAQVKKRYPKVLADYPGHFEELGNQGKLAISHQEGMLLNLYKTYKGELPKWNKIEGAIE